MTKRVQSGEDLLSTSEVGKLLGTSRFTVGRVLRDNPELAVRTPGRGANARWFVRRKSLAALRRAWKG